MSTELKSLLDQTERENTLIETHISWVVLGPRFVFKFKKPVDYGFLDFTTLEKRKRGCETEVELNSRLTNDVYLAVTPVRRSTEGGHTELYVDDPDFPFPATERAPRSRRADPIVDYAVKMRRLDDDVRADNLLTQGKLEDEHIEALAELLYRFHEQCEAGASIVRHGLPQAISKNVEQNFEQTSDLIEGYLSPRLVEDLRVHQLGFLRQNTGLLEGRAARGRVRDGHGDLRLEHVYFASDGIQIIDCIEFNDEFRYADVCADLAFLVMDLRHQGASKKAERLLGIYAERSGDFELYELIDFYEAYRAFVRGKVMALLESQKADSGHRDQSLHRETRRFFLHAVAAQERHLRPPRIVAVGGLIASGKSTISKRIANAMGTVVLDADRFRKRLGGLSPEQSSHDAPFAGLYAPGISDEVYGRLIDTALAIARTGRSVVIDATFRLEAYRERLVSRAKERHLSVQFVWCHADRTTTMQRLAERARASSTSDGRAEIFDEIAASAEPPTGEELRSTIELDTTRPRVEQDEALAELFDE